MPQVRSRIDVRAALVRACEFQLTRITDRSGRLAASGSLPICLEVQRGRRVDTSREQAAQTIDAEPYRVRHEATRCPNTAAEDLGGADRDSHVHEPRVA